MSSGWIRLAPLTGVVASAFGVAGAVIEIVTNPPGSDASGRDVIAFYSAQAGTQQHCIAANEVSMPSPISKSSAARASRTAPPLTGPSAAL